jgi:hypothetical protein
MIKAYISINLSNGNTIKYVRDIVSDSLGVNKLYYGYEGPGYQELGLNHVSSYDESGLEKNSIYYFNVDIDSDRITEYSITTGSKTTFDYIVFLINKELEADGAKCIIRRSGDLRFYSTSTSAGTSISLSAGISGTDLFTSLNNFSDFETAVDGEQYADLTTAGKINSDFNSLVSSVSGATNQFDLLSFPESDGATTTLIRKSGTESENELGKVFTSITVGQIVSIDIIENEIE